MLRVVQPHRLPLDDDAQPQPAGAPPEALAVRPARRQVLRRPPVPGQRRLRARQQRPRVRGPRGLPPRGGGSSGTDTSSRPSTQADQPFEHRIRAQSPVRSSSRTGRKGSSGTVGLAVPGVSQAGMPWRGTTWVGRKSSVAGSPGRGG
ncbi:hypothetical protein [Streptomyces somaliensis]|uniref:hypothetical protein n=1 Tax=Streptomyces somaliensis TaxID=78355 RepID=UPI003F7522C7